MVVDDARYSPGHFSYSVVSFHRGRRSSRVHDRNAARGDREFLISKYVDITSGSHATLARAQLEPGARCFLNFDCRIRRVSTKELDRAKLRGFRGQDR